MSLYRNRVDANQKTIIKALQAAGCTVHVVDRCPFDLVVGRGNQNWLLECKDGAKSASRRALTPAQATFRDTWRGQWAVVESVDQALAVIAA